MNSGELLHLAEPLCPFLSHGAAVLYLLKATVRFSSLHKQTVHSALRRDSALLCLSSVFHITQTQYHFYLFYFMANLNP